MSCLTAYVIRMLAVFLGGTSWYPLRMNVRLQEVLQMSLDVRSLGAEVESVGWYGKDERGDELLKLLGSAGIFVDSVFRFSAAPTISKSTGNCLKPTNISGVDREASVSSYDPGLVEIGEVIKEKASSVDAVIISDYGKGFVTNDLLSLIRQSSKFVAVDPKPVDF